MVTVCMQHVYTCAYCVYSVFTCIEEARIGLSLSLGIHGGHKGRSKNLNRGHY